MDDRGYTFWGTCKGTTQGGTRCERTVVRANGFCYWHGGDSTENMRARAHQIADKAQRRARRRLRKIERIKKGNESGGQSNQEPVS